MDTTQLKTRICGYDLLKCFAIFCVILGHSIQYFGFPNFMDNLLFKVIYSFYMPLFAILSGIFAYSSVSENWQNFVKKKGVQLLLPCISWMAVLFLMDITFNLYKHGSYTLDTLKKSIPVFISSFWFIKSLMVCFLDVFVAHKIANVLTKNVHFQSVLMFVLSIIGCFLFDFLNSSFLAVFFIFGIWLKKNVFLFAKTRVIFMLFCLFVVLLCWWSNNYLVYWVFPYTLFSWFKNAPDMQFRILIYIYRAIIGIFGSLLFIALFLKIRKAPNFFIKIGRYTLGIYCCQYLIIERFLSTFIDLSFINNILLSCLVLPLFSVVFICLSTYVLDFLARNKWFALFFLGHSSR